MGSEEVKQQPHLILANKLFLLNQPDLPDIEKVTLRDEVLAFLEADDMAPLYQTLVENSILDLDDALLVSMRLKNQEEIVKLDEKSSDVLSPVHGTNYSCDRKHEI